MACRYCYARHGSQNMTLEMAMRAIHAAGRPDCGVIFFGGEPLLRLDLIKQVVAACEAEKDAHHHYKITTNGTLLDEDFLDYATANRIHVALSCDGIREAHNAHRLLEDGSGSFDAVVKWLGPLLKRQPYAPVMLTVNPDTIRYYVESVKWLADQGVRYIISSLNYAADWADADAKALEKAYKKLFDWHLENYRAGRKIYFAAFDKRIASHIFSGHGVSCELGRRQISVGPDGSLYPCVQFVGRSDYTIGHALTGLDPARRDAIYHANERDKTDCAGCALNGRCHNKCGCMCVQTTGRLDALPPILCAYERFMIPLADALAERLFKERNALFLQRHYNPAFPVMSFLEDLGVN